MVAQHEEHATELINKYSLKILFGTDLMLYRHCTFQNPYLDGELGILTKGSYADILLVKGNPVENLSFLSDTANIRMIMKDGVIYKNTI